MNKVFCTILLLMLPILSASVYGASCVQENNKVGFLGLDSTGGGASNNGNLYVSVSDHNGGCGCNNFRFYSANADTKAALSILLTARMTDKVVRIDLIDSTNCDSAYRVYIQ